jgi:hypothetical protein
MKVIIEFELPEDQEQYDMANDAHRMYMAIWDIKQLFRSTLKYNPKGLTSKELEQWEAIREEFFDILDNNNLKLH